MSNLSDKDQFQYWLMAMDDSIDSFINQFPMEIQRKLDMSFDSLATLEEIVLQKYQDSTDARPLSEAKFIDGAARYFGEVLRKNSGSTWKIDFEDKKDVFFGLPILFGGKINSVAICPLTSITASINRRTGSFLQKKFNAIVNG